MHVFVVPRVVFRTGWDESGVNGTTLLCKVLLVCEDRQSDSMKVYRRCGK